MLAPPTGERLPAITRLLLAFATAWSLLILAAGAVVPVMSWEATETSTDGVATTTTGSSALVAAEGWSVLVPLAVPLLTTLTVTFALARRRHRGAAAVAWSLTGVLAVLNLLALMSIGPAVVPITVALVAACLTARLPPAVTVDPQPTTTAA